MDKRKYVCRLYSDQAWPDGREVRCRVPLCDGYAWMTPPCSVSV